MSPKELAAAVLLRVEDGWVRHTEGSIRYFFEKVIEAERERCAKIAESMAIPGHSVQAPSCIEIAKRIREGT
jgi:hypothetical protein